MNGAAGTTDARTVRLWAVAGGVACGGLAAEALGVRALMAATACVAAAAGAERWCARPHRRTRTTHRPPHAELLAARIGVAVRAPTVSAPTVSAPGRGTSCAAVWLRALVGLCVAAAFGATIVTLRASALDRAGLAALHRERAHLAVEVLDDPDVRGGSMRALVAVVAASGPGGDPVRIRGVRALLSLDPVPAVPPRAGDQIVVEASLREERARWARRRGIAVRAYAESFAVTGRTHSVLLRTAERVRAAVRATAARVPGDGRGMLEGLLIGDTARLNPAIAEWFRATGLAHLTAVSGENLALVLALIGALVRAARAGPRTHLAVLAFGALVFSAAARFEPSVVRAGVMAGVALGARGFGARGDPRHTLAAAVLLILLVDPLAAASLGFQLSVLATLGLLVVSPRIVARTGGSLFARALGLTLGATLATTPLIVAVFGRISLVAIPANLVVAPLAAPVTLIGAAGAACALLWRPLGLLAAPVMIPLALMRGLARAFASLPAPEMTVHGAIAVAVALCTAAIALRAGRPPPQGKRSARAPIVATALLLVAATIAAGPAPRGLVVTMLDVGQGEAIVVRAGARTMLIDGGGDPALLRRRLAEVGIARIDLLVLSHPHADHLNGLTGVAGTMTVGRALDPQIDPGVEAQLPSYAEVIGALAREGVPVDRAVSGETFALGGARIDVLWPPYVHLAGTDSDVNNNSVVLRATFGADRILFAGETQEEAQQALLDAGVSLEARILKVSHHGSKRMLPAFYRATGAAIALIPVGQNRYGHPAAETLAAIQGMRVLRSDLDGTVTVGLDGHGGAALRTTRS